MYFLNDKEKITIFMRQKDFIHSGSKMILNISKCKLKMLGQGDVVI